MVEVVAPVNAAMSRTPGLSRRKAWSEARRSVATVRTSGQAKRNSSTSIPKGAGGQPVQHQVAPNKKPVLGKDMLHSYPPVYVPAAGTAERGVCVPCG